MYTQYCYKKKKKLSSGPRKENSLGDRKSLPSNYFKRVGSHACACDADRWPLSDGKYPSWDFESGDRSCWWLGVSICKKTPGEK